MRYIGYRSATLSRPWIPRSDQWDLRAEIYPLPDGSLHALTMNDDDVRERAQAMCDALVAGDVEQAIVDFSEQLRRNLGEVLSLLPLPASEATVESVERGATGYDVMLRVVGTSEEAEIRTRWKDRDGQPKVVEASHLSRTAIAEPTAADETGLAVEGEPQL